MHNMMMAIITEMCSAKGRKGLGMNRARMAPRRMKAGNAKTAMRAERSSRAEAEGGCGAEDPGELLA